LLAVGYDFVWKFLRGLVKRIEAAIPTHLTKTLHREYLELRWSDYAHEQLGA
jgi:hypothetical protein